MNYCKLDEKMNLDLSLIYINLDLLLRYLLLVYVKTPVRSSSDLLYC